MVLLLYLIHLDSVLHLMVPKNLPRDRMAAVGRPANPVTPSVDRPWRSGPRSGHPVRGGREMERG